MQKAAGILYFIQDHPEIKDQFKSGYYFLIFCIPEIFIETHDSNASHLNLRQNIEAKTKTLPSQSTGDSVLVSKNEACYVSFTRKSQAS